MLVALVAVGAVSIVAGTLTAVFASRFPGHRQKIEEVGGGLFALGLVLVAASFPAL